MLPVTVHRGTKLFTEWNGLIGNLCLTELLLSFNGFHLLPLIHMAVHMFLISFKNQNPESTANGLCLDSYPLKCPWAKHQTLSCSSKLFNNRRLSVNIFRQLNNLLGHCFRKGMCLWSAWLKVQMLLLFLFSVPLLQVTPQCISVYNVISLLSTQERGGEDIWNTIKNPQKSNQTM